MRALLIYGATGYTGELVARRAVADGLRPILAARHEAAVAALAGELGLAHRAFALDRADAIDLSGVGVMLSCAGPFSETAGPLVDACLRERAHYLDITGEAAVFESVAARDAEAIAAGVMLLPGVGFDVVPTDCLAAHLAARLPTATELRLAFTVSGRDVARDRAGIARRGQARGPGSPGRRARACASRPPGNRVDFGDGARVPAVAIPGRCVHRLRHDPHPEHRGVRGAAPVDAGGASRQSVARPARHQRTGAAARRAVGARPRERALGGRAGRRRASDLGRGARRGGGDGGFPPAYARALPADRGDRGRDPAKRALDGDAAVGFQTPARGYGADFVLGFDGVSREDEADPSP